MDDIRCVQVGGRVFSLLDKQQKDRQGEWNHPRVFVLFEFIKNVFHHSIRNSKHSHTSTRTHARTHTAAVSHRPIGRVVGSVGSVVERQIRWPVQILTEHSND